MTLFNLRENKMKYTFADMVVVDEENIGVVLKCWGKNLINPKKTDEFKYEVYVRMYNGIKEYKESEIERYMVRHKYLSNEEKEYQNNAINGI